MNSTRHPHPHIDPRQPRDGSKPRTNPPVFAWKPPEGACEFALTVARDPSLKDVCLKAKSLKEPLFLPEKAFAPGRHFWQWLAPGVEPEIFSFEIAPDAVTIEVPPAGEWLRRFPAKHPRLYVRPEDVPALRDSRDGERAGLWRTLRAEADALLEQPHEIAEPPFLPDWKANYRAAYDVWARILWESRRFVGGAETLALAYLAGGETKYARAACRRMASISRWDPNGSSHLAHNDEAHMSVIWNGPTACDWAWDQFTDEERARVIEQFRLRGRITYEHMHGRGSYGVTRFDSHAGREVVFLAQIALVFHEEIPEAAEWLEWLRPVLCGIWPIWAGDDGGWAEGLAYGLAYVEIMTMFASAIKRGAGVDLYKRPFWRNHARWRQACWPPYAEWIGFGDHSERWEGFLLKNADLVELIGRETGTEEFAGYVAALRAEAPNCPTPPERKAGGISPLRYLARPAGGRAKPSGEDRVLTVFPAVGWAAVRASIADPSRDVAMIFRSSPFGAYSHSHANNNDFIVHVAGKVLAMPSGYYDGYGSEHHTHWVWHTKSHNCVTLSDAPQIMSSRESAGAVEDAFEDERLAYFLGDADASYRDRAARCRRHVAFLKAEKAFVMVDEFLAAPGIVSALQWNIHSWNEFAVDRQKNAFRVERGGSALSGHFLLHHTAFFSLSEGWDPPPVSAKPNELWFPQHHLRFTPKGLVSRCTLGVVLCAGCAAFPAASVEADRVGDVERARVGDSLVLVNQGQGIEHGGVRSDALAVLVVGGKRYEIGEGGMKG